MGRLSQKGAVLVALLLVLIVLIVVDHRQKTASFDVPRHLGPGLICYLEDAPEFWRSAAASSPGQVAREHFRRPLQDVAVAIRKATGIRPTPTRWNVWLGKRAWAHWTPGAVVLAVRPGILLNTYLRAREWWHRADSDAMSLADWRLHRVDGMLYLSSRSDWRPEQTGAWASRDAVQNPSAANVYCVLRDGEERWRMTVNAEGPWRLDGTLAPHHTDTPLLAAQAPLEVAWPTPVIFSVAAADGQGAAVLSRMGLDALGCEDSAPTLFNVLRCLFAQNTNKNDFLRLARAVAEDWLQRAALWEMEAWPVPVFETAGARAVALLDLELDGGEAIPVMAMAARTPTHDTAAVAAQWPDQFLVNPYQWHGVSGFRIPLLSDIMEFCYAAEKDRVYAASRESVMELLMARKPSFEGSRMQAAARLDWASMGNAIVRGRRALFQAGYFPGEDQMAFEGRFRATAQGMQRLGRAEMVVESESSHDTGLRLRGALFQGASL